MLPLEVVLDLRGVPVAILAASVKGADSIVCISVQKLSRSLQRENSYATSSN
jgi:predicted transcriptional regulator